MIHNHVRKAKDQWRDQHTQTIHEALTFHFNQHILAPGSASFIPEKIYGRKEREKERMVDRCAVQCGLQIDSKHRKLRCDFCIFATNK